MENLKWKHGPKQICHSLQESFLHFPPMLQFNCSPENLQFTLFLGYCFCMQEWLGKFHFRSNYHVTIYSILIEESEATGNSLLVRTWIYGFEFRPLGRVFTLQSSLYVRIGPLFLKIKRSKKYLHPEEKCKKFLHLNWTLLNFSLTDEDFFWIFHLTP